MREKSGCQPGQVRKALSHLAQAGLIYIYEEGVNELETRDRQPTLYRMMGEFADSSRKNPTTFQIPISL